MANKEKSNALMSWLNDNPEALNMGMGFLKSMQEQPRQRAQAANEIARSQYGYLLGQGGGDMSRVGDKTLSDRLMQGYISGAATRQSNEMNKKIMDLLGAKAGRDKAEGVKALSTLGPMSKVDARESQVDPIDFASLKQKFDALSGKQDQPVYSVDFNANPTPQRAPANNARQITGYHPRTGMPIYSN